jgi:hypothetical protein
MLALLGVPHKKNIDVHIYRLTRLKMTNDTARVTPTAARSLPLALHRIVL